MHEPAAASITFTRLCHSCTLRIPEIVLNTPDGAEPNFQR